MVGVTVMVRPHMNSTLLPRVATASAHQNPYLHAHPHTNTQTHEDAHTGLHKLQQSRLGHQSWFLPFIQGNRVGAPTEFHEIWINGLPTGWLFESSASWSVRRKNCQDPALFSFYVS